MRIFWYFVPLIALCCFNNRAIAGPVDDIYWMKKIADELTLVKSYEKAFAKCEVCRAVVTIIRSHGTGPPSNALIEVMIFFCEKLGIESDVVCNGIVPRFKDMLFKVVELTSLSTSDICSLAFNNECGVTSAQVNWTVKTSSIPKPPVKPIPLPSPGAPRWRIAQVSDTHVDERYTPNSPAECSDPLCCRANSTVIKKKAPTLAGFWGSFTNCDIPERTLRASIKYLGTVIKPDFVYWTGDIMPHNVWENTREDNIKQFRNTMNLLKTYLPKTTVIPAVGNHEGVPVNSFPIPQIKGNLSVEWLYNALADEWSHYIPEKNLKTFRYGGYYKFDISPKLRVISLNMNYCNNLNWWILINTTDPTEQLQWFVNELQECEDKGILVHVIGHIPPGSDNCLSVWSRNFHDIVNRYESTIVGQFYGHTHFDEFEVFFDKQNTSRAFATAFIAPSITTYETGNPAFRVYHIDGDHRNSTHQVVDYETHYMSLEIANKNPTDSYIPEWDITSSAKDLFEMPSLQPQAYADYIKRLEKDDNAFKAFYRIYMKRLPNATYDAKTKASILCNLRSSQSDNSCKFENRPIGLARKLHLVPLDFT